VNESLARGSRLARAHWLFLGLLAAGVALRVVTWLAYRPVLLNSVEYLASSERLRPGTVHPVGYPAFVRLLPLGSGLEVIPLVQHLLGLAVAVLLYVLLLRLGVRNWLAALATGPVLLDAYQLGIEQYVTPEAVFELLLVAGAALLLWRRPPGVALAAIAGVLFAAVGITRSIGLLAIVPALFAALFLRGRSAAIALLVAFALPVVAYAAWFDSTYGYWGVTGSQGRFLYARVAPFADCEGLALPPEERALCPTRPVGRRLPVNDLIWSPLFSPLNRLELAAGTTRNEVADRFAQRAIRHQPLDYVRAVVSDIGRAFAPTRTTVPGEFGAPPWEFHDAYPTFFRGSVCSPETRTELINRLPGVGTALAAERAAGCAERRALMTSVIRDHGDEPHLDSSLVSFLRTYQRFGYVPGPLLALGLILGIVAALGVGRARTSGLRPAAFLFSGLAVVVCLGSVVATVFSWRYQIPQLVLLPPAFAIAVTALTGRPERARKSVW
jgi:hypothetical protein